MIFVDDLPNESFDECDNWHLEIVIDQRKTPSIESNENVLELNSVLGCCFSYESETKTQ